MRTSTENHAPSSARQDVETLEKWADEPLSDTDLVAFNQLVEERKKQVATHMGETLPLVEFQGVVEDSAQLVAARQAGHEVGVETRY